MGILGIQALYPHKNILELTLFVNFFRSISCKIIIYFMLTHNMLDLKE